MFPLFHPSLLSAAALLGMAGNFNQTGTDGQPCCGSPFGCGDGCLDEYQLIWTEQTGVYCTDHGDGTSTKVTWRISASAPYHFTIRRLPSDCLSWHGGVAVVCDYTCDYFDDCSDCSTSPAASNFFSGTPGISIGILHDVSVGFWRATVYFWALSCSKTVGPAQAEGTGTGGPCPTDVTFTNGFTVA